jgi:hypothetical protein
MAGHGVPHHAANDEHKRVGIFIAVIAVLMAIIGALAKQQANEMIMKEVKASNGFAWYQAKRQRVAMNELELKRIEVELAGAPTDAQRQLLEAQQGKLAAKNAEYEPENKDILVVADADKRAAVVASHRHHWFEYSEICMHISVVLCSLVLLTERKLFLHLGIVATVAGLLIAGLGWFVTHHDDGHAAEVKPTAPAAAAKP